MEEVAGEAVGIGLPYLVLGLKVQYRYLFCFGSFRHKLDKQVEELKGVQEHVTCRVEVDRMNGRQIYGNVEKWLKDVSHILDEADSLKEQMNNQKVCFMGRTCWYTLSKRFKKKTSEIIELREKGDNYEEVSLPRTHLPIPYLSSNDFMLSESSKAALHQIMEGLKDESTKVIGLYGMGGVGKTTLAEQVIKSVKDSKLFDKIVMVVVSQTPDFMDIQDKVAAVLELKFEGENDVRTKAGLLSLRLEKEEKILIILDDIWNIINLPTIGVAFTADQKGCKILLTTRLSSVCNGMNCTKVIHLDVMSDSEAWELFKDRAGLDDASPVNDIATKVVKECGGLPIAIVPLACALRNNTRIQWKHALQCLRKSNLVGIKNIEHKNAYKCLKLSYDILNGEDIKLCFLMCSLFPEDHEIQIEVLVRYIWGLGVCKDADTIEEARIEVQSCIDHLKDYCLLRGNGTNMVKMHDVVRHCALWIASERFTLKYIESSNMLTISKSLEDYMAICLKINGTQELPSGLVCPKLKLLLLGGDGATFVSDTYFEQMRALEVLAVKGCRMAPQLLDTSINLRVLRLEYCKSGNISSLGNHKKLEILSFFHSDIVELPDGIGEMEGLKVLDLSNCRHLERIPAGLILKLSCLEELYVTGSPIKLWESRPVNTGHRGKASLSELNSLSKLTVLSLDNIRKCLLPDSFVLPNLTRFQIVQDNMFVHNYPVSRRLELNVFNNTFFKIFEIFFSKVEHMVMRNNDGIRSIVLKDVGIFHNLNFLELSDWKKMICLIETTVQKVATTAFPNLKKLTLLKMESLKEVCLGDIPNGFLQKLETVFVKDCPKLCVIFQVEQLSSRNETGDCILFSSLAELSLYNLPELRCVWEGPTQNVSLGGLTNVTIEACSKLTSIFSLSVGRTLVFLKSLMISDCDELEYIIEEEKEKGETSSTSHAHPCFTRLENLYISGCNRLKYVFPMFVDPFCLQKLEQLSLHQNAMLENIFNYGKGGELDILMSHLKSLKVTGSPKLTSFSGGYCSDLSFPSLQFLEITDCGIQFPLHLQVKQLQVVYLEQLPKEWGHNSLAQLLTGNLPNLKDFRVESLIGVEDVIRLSSNSLELRKLTLPKLLQQLHIFHICPLLKHITELILTSCHELKYILSPALVENLTMLKVLQVQDCKELVQIIGCDEEVDDQITSYPYPTKSKEDKSLLLFTKLESISIRQCEKMKYVFPVSVAPPLQQLRKFSLENNADLEQIFKCEKENRMEFGWTQLENLTIKGSPKLNNFVPGNHVFSSFPSLKLLSIEYVALPPLPRLETKQLREVTLSKVPKEWWHDNLSTLISSDLPNLEKLEVQSLEGVEELIRLEVDEEMSDFLLPIQLLNLNDLPKLAHIWYCPSYTRILQNLTNLWIRSCDKLSYIFPPTLAHNLPMLEWLIIEDCKELVQIIGSYGDGDRNEKEEENGETSLLFFTRLEKISIRRCDKLKHIFPMSVAPSLQKLRLFELEDNVELEQIFKYEIGNELDVELSNVVKLYIQGSPKLITFAGSNHSYFSFPSVQKLRITSCALPPLPRLETKQLKVVHLHDVPKEWWHNHISPLIIQDSTNLQKLRVESLEGVEEVLRLEVDEERSDLVLPIQNLSLRNLDQLTHIWKCPSYTSLLQNLTELQMFSCNKLRYVFPSALAQNLLMLKSLIVEDCNELGQIIGSEEERYQKHRIVTSFPNMQKIIIRSCNKIKFVFPQSVVCGLPKLSDLDVQHADGLEHIFGNDTLEAETQEFNEEKVVLPRLKRLVLKELPSLRDFSIAGCNYIFPLMNSMNELEVEGCPNMTKIVTLSSTHGILYT